MPTEKSQKVKSFLKQYAYNISVNGGSGLILSLPDYEIHPREFLSFAEMELQDLSSAKSIVNCVSNLKRAIDCQIDVFLFALNILSIYKKRNLGVDRKLGFIEKCGFFNKKSLSRINTIRNKLEHDYQVPKIDEIHVYFDLISAFISVLEFKMLIAGANYDVSFDLVEYSKDEDDEEIRVGTLSSVYDAKNTQHLFEWEVGGVKEKFIASNEDLDELAAFLHCHSLLVDVRDTYHGQYANSRLQKL